MAKQTLEQERQRRALARAELARLAALATSTIWRIEHARHVPLPPTRRRLSSALGLEPLASAWPEGSNVYARAAS